ncbi:MAG: acyl-CoA dehydrogenase family protein [Candidatus Hydrogenedentota bacterium]
MDFKDTPQEAAFRDEVRSWLKANAPKFEVTKLRNRTQEEIGEGLDQAKAWQAAKADAGFAGITWPEAYGGRGASPILAVVYEQEESKYQVPRGYFDIGIGMAGPTMMAYANEQQKQRYLPKMLRGEEIWCQLFSEPSAGSDLAGLRTRAEKDGDTWTVNGQKVWTSGAHYSDLGILVTRHDPTLPKHMGLTYFYIDMHSAGVEVVRIKQISGGSNFCEVFLNDLKIPDSQRLGEIGDGWSVSLTTLMNERLAVGDAPPPNAKEFLALLRTTELPSGPALKDPAVRERLADWYVQAQGLKFTKFRTMTALSRGQTPGPEASIAKTINASKLQDICSYMMDLEGMGGILTGQDVAPAEGTFQDGFLFSPGFRIAGGTDEILRNIIAERVLGLPPDIRVDKKVSFAELASGKAN